MDVKRSPTTELGITPTENDLTRQVLLKQGVTNSDCITVGHGVASTYDESRAVRAWVEETKAHSVIIPTDLFHTRRARWIFEKNLESKKQKIEIHVRAVDMPRYGATNWWLKEDGLIAFQNEVVKSVFYHLRY